MRNTQTLFMILALLLLIDAGSSYIRSHNRNDRNQDLSMLADGYHAEGEGDWGLNLFPPGPMTFRSGRKTNTSNWQYSENLIAGQPKISGVYELEILKNTDDEVVFFDSEREITLFITKHNRHIRFDNGSEQIVVLTPR